MCGRSTTQRCRGPHGCDRAAVLLCRGPSAAAALACGVQGHRSSNVRLIESSATLIARALEQAASLRNIRMSRHETIYDEGKRFGSLSEVAMPQPPA